MYRDTLVPLSPLQALQPNPTRVVPMMGPGFQPLAHVPDMSSKLRIDGIVAGRKIFIVDTGATFSLFTSYSGPTQNSEITIKGFLESL